jgi:hypothetical protein
MKRLPLNIPPSVPLILNDWYQVYINRAVFQSKKKKAALDGGARLVVMSLRTI